MQWRKTNSKSSSQVAQIKKRATGGNETKFFRFLVVSVLIHTLQLSAWAEDKNFNEKIHFNIPRQKVNEALVDYAEQAEVTFIYPFDEAWQKTANKVVGEYTRNEAIQLLLKGTGLRPEFASNGVLSVRYNQNIGQQGNVMNKKKGLNGFSGIAAALLSVFTSHGASGQDASSDKVGNMRTGEIEEIIVTAQRQEERIQDVPIAITAVSGDALADSGIADVETLEMLTPGLSFSRSESAASPYIRGIGANTTASGNEGSVATYVDGIYLRDMRTLNQAYNNIARVEVLKGPQGTLFGRNATGGLIQTITKTPSQNTELVAELKAGNFEVFQGDVYGTTGISDNIAADIAISVRNQGTGTGKNITPSDISFVPGAEIGFHEHNQVRSKWLITPSDQTDITLTFQWGDSKSDAGYNTVCGEGQICRPSASTSPNFRDILGPESTRQSKNEAWLVAMRVDHGFDDLNFTSITSYQDTESASSRNPYEPVVHQTRANTRQLTETFSQELQLSSDYESKLQWITGVFFWDDQSVLDPLDIVSANTGFTTMVKSRVDSRSYAFYGQSYYDITESTQLTLGTRWTKDKREVEGRTTLLGGLFVIPFGDDADFEAWTWRVALSHNFSEDILGYISYNRGFKSGGFNSAPISGSLDPVLQPEFVDAYAVGIKSDFFDNRLRINAEAFFNKIKNLQLRIIDTEHQTVRYVNAAEGEMKGLEATVAAVLSNNLTLQTGLSLLDTEYVSFPGCTMYIQSPFANGGQGGNFINPFGNCSGKEMIQSPELTFNVVLNHSLPLSSGRIDSTLTYYYNDGYFYKEDNNWGQPSYEVINAAVNWISGGDRYEIGVYGNNLAEEKYSTNGLSDGTGNLIAIGIFPREYGLRLKYKF